MADETAKHSEHPEMQPVDAPTRQIDIAVGAEVSTSDGHKLGEIKEIAIGYFKVDKRLGSDYWLQRQFVTSNEGGTVTMSFTKDEAGNYEVAILPEGAVFQGQDAHFDAKHDPDAIGFETEYVGGPVLSPDNDATNPASATIEAAERQANYRNRDG